MAVINAYGTFDKHYLTIAIANESKKFGSTVIVSNNVCYTFLNKNNEYQYNFNGITILYVEQLTDINFRILKDQFSNVIVDTYMPITEEVDYYIYILDDWAYKYEYHKERSKLKNRLMVLYTVDDTIEDNLINHITFSDYDDTISYIDQSIVTEEKINFLAYVMSNLFSVDPKDYISELKGN